MSTRILCAHSRILCAHSGKRIALTTAASQGPLFHRWARDTATMALFRHVSCWQCFFEGGGASRVLPRHQDSNLFSDIFDFHLMHLQLDCCSCWGAAACKLV